MLLAHESLPRVVDRGVATAIARCSCCDLISIHAPVLVLIPAAGFLKFPGLSWCWLYSKLSTPARP